MATAVSSMRRLLLPFLVLLTLLGPTASHATLPQVARSLADLIVQQQGQQVRCVAMARHHDPGLRPSPAAARTALERFRDQELPQPATPFGKAALRDYVRSTIRALAGLPPGIHETAEAWQL